jgi:hypothetical protein
MPSSAAFTTSRNNPSVTQHERQRQQPQDRPDDRVDQREEQGDPQPGAGLAERPLGVGHDRDAAEHLGDAPEDGGHEDDLDEEPQHPFHASGAPCQHPVCRTLYGRLALRVDSPRPFSTTPTPPAVVMGSFAPRTGASSRVTCHDLRDRLDAGGEDGRMTPPLQRPALVFDGDCGFCTRSASVARRVLPADCAVVPWQRGTSLPSAPPRRAPGRRCCGSRVPARSSAAPAPSPLPCARPGPGGRCWAGCCSSRSSTGWPTRLPGGRGQPHAPARRDGGLRPAPARGRRAARRLTADQVSGNASATR